MAFLEAEYEFEMPLAVDGLGEVPCSVWAHVDARRGQAEDSGDSACPGSRELLDIDDWYADWRAELSETGEDVTKRVSDEAKHAVADALFWRVQDEPFERWEWEEPPEAEPDYD